MTPSANTTSLTRTLRYSILSILLGILFPLISTSQITTQWRGADRHGIYPDKELLNNWPSEGPALIRVYENIGNGYGSPTFAENMLYITGEINSTAFLFAFDTTGNLLWKRPFGKEWVESYAGSRSAPTVVDDLVYVTSGKGNITCLDRITGEQKWSKEMVRDLQGRFALFGYAEAPLVNGNLVFLTSGGQDTNVVAFDRFTGEIKWICPGSGDIPGYNSPILIHLPKRDILAVFTAYSFLGIDTRTGKLLWSHDQINIPIFQRKPGNGDTHSNSAWYEDGFIYYLAGDGNGAVKLLLSDNGKEIKQLWRNKVIDNYMSGFVIRDNRIYTCTNSGKNLVTLNIESGEVMETLKIGIGSLIWADEKIYYYTQGGKAYLVDPKKMEVITSFKIDKGTREHFSHPVIHQGILYIRHGNVLLAYDIARNTK